MDFKSFHDGMVKLRRLVLWRRRHSNDAEFFDHLGELLRVVDDLIAAFPKKVRYDLIAGLGDKFVEILIYSSRKSISDDVLEHLRSQAGRGLDQE